MKVLITMIMLTAGAAQATNDRPPVKPAHSAYAASSSRSSVSNANRVRQDQAQRQSATSISRGGSARTTVTAPATAINADSNNASQSVNMTSPRTAATAYAPSMQPTVNCAGVVSGGMQGTGFGLTLGGSNVDTECQRQELAKTTFTMGDPATADEILCDNDAYRQARKRAGRPCATVTVTEEERRVYSGSDPIVRMRMGLPALRE